MEDKKNTQLSTIVYTNLEMVLTELKTKWLENGTNENSECDIKLLDNGAIMAIRKKVD